MRMMRGTPAEVSWFSTVAGLGREHQREVVVVAHARGSP